MATLPFFRQGATPEPFEIQRIYVAGSSVFATIYEDAALTVILGNSLSVPLQANSAGLYPPIFVSSDITYDIKFFTQDGYSKDTYEGIIAIGGSGSGNIIGPSHQVPFFGESESGDGTLTSSSSFTFGDPSKSGALCVPSLQAISDIIIGNNSGFWNEQFLAMSYPAIGGVVQLTPGYSNTKYIYAHNNQNNASVATDKASFANLEQNGVVFASMLPNTSEDLIYLHTDPGFSYDPTTKLFTVPNLAIGSIDAAGVLVNDASGKVSSVPAATFLSETVEKTDHGFIVGEPVRMDVDSFGAQTWSSAYASADLAHTATHYVVDVIDDNKFCVASSGFWPITPASPVYGQQILGNIPGSVVNSVLVLPSGVGIQPLGMLSSTGLHINILSYVRDVTP